MGPQLDLGCLSGPPALNFVYAPRQTGKTTGLKLLIRELLRRVPPEAVAYLDLDILLSPAELRRALEYVLGRAARRGGGHSPPKGLQPQLSVLDARPLDV